MDITAKLWSFCHILRHDGVDYGDYIEQLTYLLFLKMADENQITVPRACRWQTLLSKDGRSLKEHYENVLQNLKNEKGILGQIFQEPISKIKNPSSLKKIIEGIESIGWTNLDKDVQGEAFEGLLEKIANEGKKGAGQFFTPRPLIKAIVNVTKPNPLENKGYRIADTSCGTGGFLTVAIDWAKTHLPKDKWSSVKDQAYCGRELVVRPYRLALMNLFLHGVYPNLVVGDSIYTEDVETESLDCIITNPPFGTRGTAGPPKQRSFSIETSNIQINFVQHIYEVLRYGGRAAIVLPDSALIDNKAKELWRVLISEKQCNLHTILRLPRGTFTPYANGVKACVVFMQKGEATKNIWVYDARTNVEEIKKSNRPLDYDLHFSDFVHSFGENPNGHSRRFQTQRFERYTLKDIKSRGYDLSFTKMHQSPKLEKPVYYVDKLINSFEAQLEDLKKLKTILDPTKNDV